MKKCKLQLHKCFFKTIWYYDHIYTVDGVDDESLIDVIQNTLSLPQGILNEKAKNAYDFILQNKTAKMQVKRIIDFISKDN